MKITAEAHFFLCRSGQALTVVYVLQMYTHKHQQS